MECAAGGHSLYHVRARPSTTVQPVETKGVRRSLINTLSVQARNRSSVQQDQHSNITTLLGDQGPAIPTQARRVRLPGPRAARPATQAVAIAPPAPGSQEPAFRHHIAQPPPAAAAAAVLLAQRMIRCRCARWRQRPAASPPHNQQAGAAVAVAASISRPRTYCHLHKSIHDGNAPCIVSEDASCVT
jgi:hypothetical protein